MAAINPRRWAYIMDPADYAPFALLFARDGTDSALQTGETIAAFTLNPSPAAVSAGFSISTEAGKAPVLSGDIIAFWARFTGAANSSPAFEAPGTEMAVEVTITTSTGRIMQRTGLIPAGQR